MVFGIKPTDLEHGQRDQRHDQFRSLIDRQQRLAADEQAVFASKVLQKYQRNRAFVGKYRTDHGVYTTCTRDDLQVWDKRRQDRFCYPGIKKFTSICPFQRVEQQMGAGGDFAQAYHDCA